MEYIDTILKQHFEDYRVFVEYSRLQDSIIHHNFTEALKYDIDKINKLKSKETFKSTVLYKETYLDEINNNELLSSYIQALKNSARQGVIVQRIFIIKNKKSLNRKQKQHLNDLKNNLIDVKIIKENDLYEIDRFSRNLSKNFVIINNKEVAFAYPFYGNFRFAVNIIKNEDRESIRYFNDYKNLFELFYEKSIDWEG